MNQEGGGITATRKHHFMTLDKIRVVSLDLMVCELMVGSRG